MGPLVRNVLHHVEEDGVFVTDNAPTLLLN